MDTMDTMGDLTSGGAEEDASTELGSIREVMSEESEQASEESDMVDMEEDDSAEEDVALGLVEKKGSVDKADDAKAEDTKVDDTTADDAKADDAKADDAKADDAKADDAEAGRVVRQAREPHVDEDGDPDDEEES